jgi:hypothetical protein
MAVPYARALGHKKKASHLMVAGTQKDYDSL